jgi:hypothetical protein
MKLTYFDRMEAMQHADDRSALSAADVQ